MPEPVYTLHYWEGLPGRGEFIRLAFEYTGTKYKDPKGPARLLTNVQATAHPPHFAPPLLELPNGVFLSQTANILQYIAPKLGLDGSKGLTDPEAIAIRQAHVNQLVLTNMDLADEVHLTHHPISVKLYYEEQEPEAKRRTEDFLDWRLPKFLDNFALALDTNPEGDGKCLVGSTITAADLALYFNLDGMEFAFPRRMKTMRDKAEYKKIFALKDAIAEEPNIAKYNQSDRKENYSMGIFRHYKELDRD